MPGFEPGLPVGQWVGRKERRLNPLVTVALASLDGKGAALTDMAGPFDMGRPSGCPKSKFNGRFHIPHDNDQVLTGRED